MIFSLQQNLIQNPIYNFMYQITTININKKKFLYYTNNLIYNYV